MVTLDMPADLENRLRREAAKEGLATDAYILRALQKSLPDDMSLGPVPAGSLQELELLKQVSVGLSDEEWARYSELAAKLEADALSAGELRELRVTTERIETANVERMKHLISLATLRKTSVEQLMDELGLGNGREANGGQAID